MTLEDLQVGDLVWFPREKEIKAVIRVTARQLVFHRDVRVWKKTGLVVGALTGGFDRCKPATEEHRRTLLQIRTLTKLRLALYTAAHNNPCNDWGRRISHDRIPEFREYLVDLEGLIAEFHGLFPDTKEEG